MRNFAALLNRVIGGLGRPGVVALGLLVFCLLFYLTSLAPARAELAALKERLAVLQRSGAEHARSARNAGDPVARINAFYRTFPGAENLAPAISDTYAMAGRHGLNLEQADYQYRTGSDDELAAYEMSFSLKGPYPKVRDFLLEVLRLNPGAVIDSVSFRRESASSFGVEARLRLTFFVRSKPWEYRPQGAG